MHRPTAGFMTQQHICRACHMSAYCTADGWTVCHTGGYEKIVEIKIMKFSSIPLVLLGKFHPEILTGSPEHGIKQLWGGKTNYFLALYVDIFENGTRSGLELPGGPNPLPPSSCLWTLIFEWKSVLNFNSYVILCTFLKHFDIWPSSSFRSIPRLYKIHSKLLFNW